MNHKLDIINHNGECMFDNNSTVEFLSLFKRAQPIIFSAKDDGKGKKPSEVTDKYGKAWHKTGTINEVGPWLNKHNKDAWGCFFTVNDLDQGLDLGRKRTEKMLVGINALWAEDDNKRDEPRTDWPIKPNIVVNSSPNKFHYYWLTTAKATDEHCDQWHGMMQTMVNDYGSDNNAKDLVRILRLPGFKHQKDPAHPHMVTFKLVKKTPYNWNALIEAFPPSPYILKGKTEGVKTGNAVRNSDTLTKTMAELITDYEDGHRHGPSSRSAMKLANHGVPQEDIVSILKALFPEENNGHHEQSVESAIDKIKSEGRIGSFLEVSEGKGSKEPPHFDTSFINDWPEPWPMIFRSFEGAIYQVIEEIYVPSCFALHTVLLGSIFRTVRNRGPNLNMQIISSSGVGKDSNTSEPIKLITTAIKAQVSNEIGDSLKNGLMLMDPIYQSITADTTYLKALGLEENKSGGLILNTEASGHWDMVASADNPHTEGVMRIEINAWDGQNISGKLVGKEKYNDIHNPNYTCLRLQQTEALERNLTQRMIDIGLGNRIDYYADNIDRPEVASTRLSSKNVKVSDEYIDFIKYVFTYIFVHTGEQIRVKTSQPNGVIARFEEDVLLPLVNNSDGVSRDEYKFLKRIIGSAEKQVTCITAFAYLWKLYQGEDASDMVSNQIGDIVLELNGHEYEQYALPLMEYQLRMRQHLYENTLSTSQATAEADAIDEVWSKMTKKVPTIEKEWHELGGIIATSFHSRVRAHKFFKKNPKYNDPEKINRAINNWVSANGLEKKSIEVKRKKRACYVMRG